MKRINSIILFLAALFMPILVCAQSQAVDDLYNKYSKVKGIKAEKVGKLLLMTAKAASKDFPEGLKSVKSLLVEDRSKISSDVAKSLDADITKVTAISGCEFIGGYERGNHIAKLYSQHKIVNGKVKDPLLYITGEKVIAMTEFSGEFDKDSDFIRKIIDGNPNKK